MTYKRRKYLRLTLCLPGRLLILRRLKISRLLNSLVRQLCMEPRCDQVFFDSDRYPEEKSLSIYREIPNVSPGLRDIFKHILGGLYSGGAYTRREFCVSICIFKTLKSLDISIKYLHYRQKRASLQLKSPSLCFKTYLRPF